MDVGQNVDWTCEASVGSDGEDSVVMTSLELGLWCIVCGSGTRQTNQQEGTGSDVRQIG